MLGLVFFGIAVLVGIRLPGPARILGYCWVLLFSYFFAGGFLGLCVGNRVSESP